ncbi:MAG: DUF1295 domain-containing protein [Bacteroidia bacterium]
MTIFTFAWIIIGIAIFPVLLRVTAPYGRHTSQSWGPLIPNRAGWIVMELPALVIMPALFVLGNSPKTPVSWIFPALWILHYVNRTILFPLRTHTKGKEMPLLIVVFAIFFNMANGAINGTYFGSHAAAYRTEWLADPRFIGGMILFLGGMGINWHSDNILLHLRKPGETGYKIPYGGFFRYVSCPNLLGEIIEWTGFAVLTWSLAGFSFALWTAINLIPRALDHHKWYLSHFPDYPKNRKAIIPHML